MYCLHSSVGFYDHFNMYKHSEVEEIPSRIISSTHRQDRANQLPVAENVSGILNILGDAKDAQYPIFRRPTETDSGDTVATAVIELGAKTLTVYLDNPKTASPVLKLPLDLVLEYL